jgi:hypothetical protein
VQCVVYSLVELFEESPHIVSHGGTANDDALVRA